MLTVSYSQTQSLAHVDTGPPVAPIKQATATCDGCSKEAEFVYYDSHKGRWEVKDWGWRELFLFDGTRQFACSSYQCLAKVFRKIVLSAMKEGMKYPYFAKKTEDQTE